MNFWRKQCATGFLRKFYIILMILIDCSKMGYHINLLTNVLRNISELFALKFLVFFLKGDGIEGTLNEHSQV